MARWASPLEQPKLVITQKEYILPLSLFLRKMGPNSLCSPLEPFLTGSLLVINRAPFTACILSMVHFKIVDTGDFLDDIW